MSVTLEIRDSIAILRIDTPGKLNVLNTETMREIYNKLEDIEQKAKVLVIFGGEKAFAAGDDLNEIAKLDYEKAQTTEFMDFKWDRVLHTRIPVIAGVKGYALGGGFELALACDMIFAAENAVFGFPEVNLGLMPGFGGTQLLTKIVGAKTSKTITAKITKQGSTKNKVGIEGNKLNLAQMLLADIGANVQLPIRPGSQSRLKINATMLPAQDR